MPDFTTTPLQNWNRTSDEFRVVASTKSGPQTSSIGKFLYNLKAFFGMEPGMLKDLKSENIASVARFKSDISDFFVRRADKQAGKASAFDSIHSLATKQLDYLEQGGRRLSDRSVKQVMTHVSTLTDAVDHADENLAKDYSPWVRNQALRQLDMNAILRNAGALDENGNMKRVLTDQEKTKINEGVASQLEELCDAVKKNLIQRNDTVWNGVASPQGLNELIGRDQVDTISSFGLFGTEAKDQTFFQEAQRNINIVKKGFESKWDKEPLGKKALEKELQSEMSRLARNWGSSMSQSSSFSPPENAKFRDSHPELNDFITFALAQEIQNASQKDDKNNPSMAWKEAYDNAKFDRTLRDEKFALFLAGRQIDRTNLPAETKIASKEVLGDLVKQGNECLKDNEMYGDKNVDELRGSQSLDSGYSALVQRHNKAESFLQLAKNFHSQTPGLDQLNNSLVAMATRAVTGLKASLDAYETVIKERHESGVEKYGKDIVDLIKSNPERLDLVFRAKDTPIVFEPSMVPRFIDSLQNGTGQQPGDQKTASVCRNAWNLISGQVSDRTLGQQALKDPGAFNTKAHKDDRPFGNMETKRLIEVTKAHETVVDQIQNQLSEVRGRQEALSKEAPNAPKILHDSLASFANALEKRLEDAAGPLNASREELRDRRAQAMEDAVAFENQFGSEMTELLRKHSGETFERTPNVGQKQIVSASKKAMEAPGFATTEQVSEGMLERLTTRIGQAGKTLGATETSESGAIGQKKRRDIEIMSDTDLGNLLEDVAKLSKERNDDLESIDKALGRLSNSSDNGRVAKNKEDEFLVSFLVAAKVALVKQPDAIGPVQRAASQEAAQRSMSSYRDLMPDLSNATSGISRPPETKSASPSHVSDSICEELKKDQKFGKTLSEAANVVFRLRDCHVTAHRAENRDAYYKAMDTTTKSQSVRDSKEYAKVSKEVNGYVDQVKDLKMKLQQIAKETKQTLGMGGNLRVYNLASALLQELGKVNLESQTIEYIVDTLTVLEQQKK
jgi:hypothetical protein